MKKETFKELIKEAMREVINEPEFLSKLSNNHSPVVTKDQEMVRMKLRENFNDILKETQASFNTSAFSGDLNLGSGNLDPNDAQLPSGEVSLDMIKGLMYR